MKHSELPWEFEGPNRTDSGSKYNCIVSKSPYNDVIGENGVSEEDAEFICLACNQHYDLLKQRDQLKVALDIAYYYLLGKIAMNGDEVVETILEALAAVDGE